MIVPVFARLHAVSAANAFRRVKQDTARFAVYEPACGHQIAVFAIESFSGINSHSVPLYRALAESVVYHLTFTGVN